MISQLSPTIDPKQTVASIVLSHSECASVFQKLRIDFCCKGEQSLELACSARERPVKDVVEKLQQAIAERTQNAAPTFDPGALSTSELIQHIVGVHHDYLRKALPFITPLAAKVARVHGDHNPRLIQVAQIVNALNSDLLPHLDFEENVLFPAMLAPEQNSALLTTELEKMMTEHLAVGTLLAQLRDETEEFTLPEWACTSYKTLFTELKQLELDTLTHVHLENHVLKPRFQ
jgi:regulator of cell morphogenesis and NO signaling